MKPTLFFILFSAMLSFNSNAQSQNIDTTLMVNGVCEMCKRIIEKAALSVEGVESASWSPETKVLTLSLDTSVASLQSVSDAINKGGYDTALGAATEEDYNALHGCCHYRDPEVVNAHQK